MLLTARKFRNRFFSTSLLWRCSLRSELDFWRSFFASKALDYEGFERRLDPDAKLQDSAVAEQLDELPERDSPFKILDVGAGPVTSLGRVHHGKRLDIVAIDALANRYDRLLKELSIVPAVRTVQCDGERLLALVAPNSFDLVFSRNAIDHGYNPMLIILNMVQAVKSGCTVVLKHGRNEGEQSRYKGLHQWNFTTRGDRFILWNHRITWDVTSELRGRATVKSFMEGDWLVTVCRKL